MGRLVGGIVGLGVLALVAGTAHAQGVGAGAELEMPSLGAKFTVPQGAGEWTVRKDGGEVLQRTRPVHPYLSVLLDRKTVDGASCGSVVADYQKKGLKKADKPGLVPVGWFPTVLSAASGNGDLVIMLCASQDKTVLVALVTYGATLDDPDLANLTAMLEVVGKAALAAPAADTGKPPAGGDTGKPGSASQPAPPADAAEPDRVPLPNTGLVLLLPASGGWKASAADGGRDHLTRTKPADPTLSVTVEVVRTSSREGGCAAILQQHVQLQRDELQTRPRWMPASFHESVAVAYKSGSGRELACAEVPLGYVLATVVYTGSLDAEDVASAAPVLSAVQLAASQLSKDEQKPSSSFWSGSSLTDPEVYIGGQQLAPRDAANTSGMIDSSIGVALGVRQARMLAFSSGSAFGLAGLYDLSIGYQGTHGMLLDGFIGLGFGLSLSDRVTIMPMIGGGGDAIGAGSDPTANKLKLDFDFLNFFGGALAIEFTRRVGLSVEGGYLQRGDNPEMRVQGRLMVIPRSFRRVSLGLEYKGVKDISTLWSIQVGVGF